MNINYNFSKNFKELIKKHTKLFYISPFLLVLVSAFYLSSAEAGGLKKKVRKKLTPNITSKDLAPTEGPSIHDSYAKAKEHHPTKSSIATGGKNAYQQCRATVMPSFINNSMSWGPAQIRPSGIKGKLSGKIDVGITNYRSFKSLSPPSVIVTAAGNDHPKPVSELKERASRDYNMIVVGSLKPSGYKSGFSQEGPAVTIMAPSDYHITSATSTGKYREFGGTSGATPLVTGSLAGFEWLAGYHPTAIEAKMLLEKTAIPTPYSNNKPRKNGAGMVNAYKLAMVGKELKKACGSNISCFKDLIRKNDIYNFPIDTSLDDEINRAFPGCSTTCTAEDLNSSSANCADKAEVFKKLRKQAFLHPKNKELWKKIACIYGEAGFRENAESALTTYRSLAPNKSSPKYCKQDSDCTLVPACNGEALVSGGGTGGGEPMVQKQPTMVQEQPMVQEQNNRDYLAPEFLPMNKHSAEMHYISCMQNKGAPALCNGKCRCESEEEIRRETVYPTREGEAPRPSERQTETRTYTASCLDFQCQVMMSGGMAMAPVESPSAEGEPSPFPREGSGAIQ